MLTMQDMFATQQLLIVKLHYLTKNFNANMFHIYIIYGLLCYSYNRAKINSLTRFGSRKEFDFKC